MTHGEYVCNACGFRVPADEIGVALMKEHLRSDCTGEVDPDGGNVPTDHG